MSEKRYKCSSQFLRAKCDVFRFLLLSKQQPKTQRLYVFSQMTQKKQQILTLKILNQQFFLLSNLNTTETTNQLSK